MFKKSKDVPAEVAKAGLAEWYLTLGEQDRVKLKRYVGDADASSRISFLASVADNALKDENYGFAALISDDLLEMEMSDLQMFIAREHAIDAYMGSERYDDAKSASLMNLDLWPNIADDFISINGRVPEKMNCRNRLIDVLVGVESDYDNAGRMLDRFLEMGLISAEDHELRKQSLKVHRLQRAFDGVYTFRPKE